jgi:hypothetical protein
MCIVHSIEQGKESSLEAIKRQIILNTDSKCIDTILSNLADMAGLKEIAKQLPETY